MHLCSCQAPVNLTENIRSVRKLVNGSAGILDCLSFEGGKPPPEVEAAYARAAACCGVETVQVDLAEPPLSVNVRVGGAESPRRDGSAPGSVLWHGVELDDLSGLIKSVTPDAQVVALLISTSTRDDGVSLRGLVAAQNSVAESVLVRQHPYRLAFALTDYKVCRVVVEPVTYL